LSLNYENRKEGQELEQIAGIEKIGDITSNEHSERKFAESE